MESVYPAICGSFNLHDEHSWREGFLWSRKVTCFGSVRTPGGVPVVPKTTSSHFAELLGVSEDAFIPMKIILPPHKHAYKLKDGYPFGLKGSGDLLWGCDCGRYFVIDSYIWYDYPLGVHYDVK